ncbi:hypothetical protein N8T08_007811 [Aspergillus melleus]|uniref:Uncharacterized protein n=1 Tax=Aspergillus melleus TaxID=138277 RepID=A0ACC3AXK6_9EURO|nr:hypothetical protein N8T08_007811 [Aspergillus melleus]
MPDSSSNQSSKRRKGGGNWQKGKGAIIESGDCGVFVTCDKGKEGKCIPEAVDLFTQSIEQSDDGEKDADSGSDEDEDIEAQIRREVEGLKPGSSKPRDFRTFRMEFPCVFFVKFDKSIDPEKLVHQLCVDAHTHPEQKRSRYIQRLSPMRSIRKTLSVDLEEFAAEILKPHFHSGGPPKKFAIRPVVRGNSKFNRDILIKTIAQVVGPDHTVDLKNYDLLILVEVVQNLIGMSVMGPDYDKLKKYNLAELYKPSAKTEAKTEAPEAKE